MKDREFQKEEMKIEIYILVFVNKTWFKGKGDEREI
jgi:hypothetical protein